MLGFWLTLCWTLVYLWWAVITSNIILMIVVTMLGAQAQLHVDSHTLTSVGGERAGLKGVISLSVECMDLVQMLASIIFLLSVFSLTSFPHKVLFLRCREAAGISSSFFPQAALNLMIWLSVLRRQPWPRAAVSRQKQRKNIRAFLDIELDLLFCSEANRAPTPILICPWNVSSSGLLGHFHAKDCLFFSPWGHHSELID